MQTFILHRDRRERENLDKKNFLPVSLRVALLSLALLKVSKAQCFVHRNLLCIEVANVSTLCLSVLLQTHSSNLCYKDHICNLTR